MTKEEAIKGLKENLCSLCAYGSQNMDSCDIRGCDNRDYIKALEQQLSEDKVSVEVYTQVTRERDIAIEQLRELGYDFGEKIRTSDVCMSGAELKKLDMLDRTDNELPPVTPTHGDCKDSEKLKKIEQIVDDCDSGMISCEQLFLNIRTIFE